MPVSGQRKAAQPFGQVSIPAYGHELGWRQGLSRRVMNAAVPLPITPGLSLPPPGKIRVLSRSMPTLFQNARFHILTRSVAFPLMVDTGSQITEGSRPNSNNRDADDGSVDLDKYLQPRQLRRPAPGDPGIPCRGDATRTRKILRRAEPCRYRDFSLSIGSFSVGARTQHTATCDHHHRRDCHAAWLHRTRTLLSHYSLFGEYPSETLYMSKHISRAIDHRRPLATG